MNYLMYIISKDLLINNPNKVFCFESSLIPSFYNKKWLVIHITTNEIDEIKTIIKYFLKEYPSNRTSLIVGSTHYSYLAHTIYFSFPSLFHCLTINGIIFNQLNDYITVHTNAKLLSCISINKDKKLLKETETFYKKLSCWYYIFEYKENDTIHILEDFLLKYSYLITI